MLLRARSVYAIPNKSDYHGDNDYDGDHDHDHRDHHHYRALGLTTFICDNQYSAMVLIGNHDILYETC